MLCGTGDYCEKLSYSLFALVFFLKHSWNRIDVMVAMLCKVAMLCGIIGKIKRLRKQEHFVFWLCGSGTIVST